MSEYNNSEWIALTLNEVVAHSQPEEEGSWCEVTCEEQQEDKLLTAGFKWERRIYTGHQLQLRSVFHVNEVPWGSTQRLIWARCVCVWVSLRGGNTFKFWVSQTLLHLSKMKPFANFAASVCVCVCFPTCAEIIGWGAFQKVIPASHKDKAYLCPFLPNY